MYGAVYDCLVMKGGASYSIFISYRVASETPLARLIYDDLNHTVTPGGHRVTVFWDARRPIQGEDWEEGFAIGLLNSMCILPLLSYGSTAPLAALPEPQSERSELISMGWDERPVGRNRLQGSEFDSEDNVLKEFAIAKVLLERSQPCGGVNKLECALPVLVGRQHPFGHPDYPRMGSFFDVQAGGGQYAKRPSPKTNLAAGNFLRKRASLPQEEAAAVEDWTISEIVNSFTKLQGCKLWEHDPMLRDIPLTREQANLVGIGCTGPPVDLGGVVLS